MTHFQRSGKSNTPPANTAANHPQMSMSKQGLWIFFFYCYFGCWELRHSNFIYIYIKISTCEINTPGLVIICDVHSLLRGWMVLQFCKRCFLYLFYVRQPQGRSYEGKIFTPGREGRGRVLSWNEVFGMYRKKGPIFSPVVN